MIRNLGGADGALRGWQRRHATMCAACREFIEAQERLGLALRLGATASRQEPSPFLHARITHALAGTPQPTSTWRLSPVTWTAVSGVAVALVAAMMVSTSLRLKPSVDAVRLPPDPAAVTPGTLEMGALAPMAEVQLAGLALSLDQPLEQELQLVMSDARAAINSLATTFLPEDLGPLKSSISSSPD